MRGVSFPGQEKPRDLRTGQKILLLQAGSDTPIASDHILLVKTSDLAPPTITRAKKFTFQGAQKEGICN